MNSEASNIEGHIEPFDTAFEPVSMDEVVIAEQTMGVEFPPQLKDFLRKYGRFGFAGDSFVTAGGREFGVFTVFGLSGESSNMIEDWKAHDEFQARGWVPIADDMFNNRYVWDSATGEVNYLDYESQGGPVKVAGSFDDFISAIEVRPY